MLPVNAVALDCPTSNVFVPSQTLNLHWVRIDFLYCRLVDDEGTGEGVEVGVGVESGEAVGAGVEAEEGADVADAEGARVGVGTVVGVLGVGD